MAVESFGGRYEPTHELTRTGSVVVHAAHDRWLQRPVVLARHDAAPTSADGTAASMSRARFQRMGRMLMRLAHPNVAEAYDAGRHEETVFIAFERPPRDLATELAGAPWDQDRLARLAAELTAALDVVHREGSCLDLLHPGCVGLSADGAVRLSPWPLAPPPPGWGGERAWLAPERLKGDPPSVQADVWSLGAVVLTAMLGLGPGRLDEDGLAEVSGRISRSRDPVLVAATARSLSPDPSRRFGSAAAMAAALEGGGHLTPAHPDPGGEAPILPPIRTRPLRVAAPRFGRWGWRAGAAVVAALCVPFLALQLESAPPSVASCATGPSHPAACPGPAGRSGGPSIAAAAPIQDAPLVHVALAGSGAAGPTATAAPEPGAAAPQRAPHPAPALRPLPPPAPDPGRAVGPSPPSRPVARAPSPAAPGHDERAGYHDHGWRDVGLPGAQSGRER